MTLSLETFRGQHWGQQSADFALNSSQKNICPHKPPSYGGMSWRWSRARRKRLNQRDCEMFHRRSVGEMRMRYLSEIPLTIERGVLCHNIVGHSVDMRPGLYGFRAWIEDKPPRGFKQC
jgi:hypothetical protein